MRNFVALRQNAGALARRPKSEPRMNRVPANRAFNRTRRYGPSIWQKSVAARRLTWSRYASLEHRRSRAVIYLRELAAVADMIGARGPSLF